MTKELLEKTVPQFLWKSPMDKEAYKQRIREATEWFSREYMKGDSMGLQRAGTTFPKTITLDETNKTLTGYYLSTKTVETEFGIKNVHEFVTEEGEVVQVWGRGQLDHKLTQVPRGAYTEIKHLGLETFKKGKKTLKVNNFDVMYDAERTKTA